MNMWRCLSVILLAAASTNGAYAGRWGNSGGSTSRPPQRVKPLLLFRRDQAHSEPQTPQAPQAGRVFEVDASSDPRGAWRCLQVSASSLSGAGQGVFAGCDLKKDTLLGEYRGERFTFGERGASRRLQFDWPYIWKVPRCLAPAGNQIVIRRQDKAVAHNCSNRNGYVYVDAVPLADPASNPLRFVNGAPPADVAGSGSAGRAQAKVGSQLVANVEVFFADDRVFYFTGRNISRSEELVVDYGAEYWKERRRLSDEDGGVVSDWSDFLDH